MPRVKRSVNARKKRRKVLEQAKGYCGTKHSSYRRAKEQVQRSLKYAYRDRRVRKREFRKLWIVRINAGAREHGLSYNHSCTASSSPRSSSTARCWPTWRSPTPLLSPRS